MKYITLLCSMGMSTSLLVNKMKDAAKQRGDEVTIKAMAKDSFASYDGQTDVILLGPQIRHMYDELKNKYEPQNIKVAVINNMDYGMMDGKKVLEFALNL
ncbi:MAG: PTS sugar transporter subunit IIB [Lachnospiraceae bacterium]